MRIRKSHGRRVDVANGHLIELARDQSNCWSLALTFVDAGCSLTRHHHSVATEVYIGLSGQGSVQVGKDLLSLRPGDHVRIDPGKAHHALASDAGMTFLALTMPGYDPADFFVSEPEK
jgi:quercetin dioxygenase-like cupin family protein